MQKYKKKGQMLGAVQAVIALIAGVGVSTLVLIFVGALGGQTYNLVEPKLNEIGNSSVVNQSVTFTDNSTATYLGHTDIHSGSLSVLNSSVDVGLGNFTIDYDAGQVTLNNIDFNNTALDFSYNHGDYSIRTDVKAGIKSGFSALKQTGDYLPIIVLAIVIALVLALVLGMTGVAGGGNTGRGSAL